MRRWAITGAVIVVGLGLLGYIFRQSLIASLFAPTDSSINTAELVEQPQLVAENLETPWSLTFLPDDSLLVSERRGRLVKIGTDRQAIAIKGVEQTSEGGLLGVALDPNFSANQRIYIYYTTRQQGRLINQVDRYRLTDDRVEQRRLIIGDIPAASIHNGGALAFGPDGKLYVSTGDAGDGDLAQDKRSLAGKILRVNPDGSTPDDNPFANLVWSYGHRNPQGMAWDNRQRLWSVEHGPSGVETGRDELNLIQRGANYGWPIITGDETGRSMKTPIIHSGDHETWAPSGMAYLDGALYFAGLRGQSLYRAIIQSDDSVRMERLLRGQHGRLRAVTAYAGALYVATSNHDGRGDPRPGDDRILRLR